VGSGLVGRSSGNAVGLQTAQSQALAHAHALRCALPVSNKPIGMPQARITQ
jgi:hypothetical protein